MQTKLKILPGPAHAARFAVSIFIFSSGPNSGAMLKDAIFLRQLSLQPVRGAHFYLLAFVILLFKVGIGHLKAKYFHELNDSRHIILFS